MNKPILVNNQQEWERLAPVLEKQGKKYAGGSDIIDFSPSKFPFLLRESTENGTLSAQQNHIDLSADIYLVEDYLAAQESEIDLIQHLADAIENKELKCTFGLTPKHIEVIERILNDHMVDRRVKWETIGKEIGWESHTACEWYIRKLQAKAALYEAEKLDHGLAKVHIGNLETRIKSCEKALEERDEKHDLLTRKIKLAIAELNQLASPIAKPRPEISEGSFLQGIEYAKELLNNILNQPSCTQD